jgi:hypothetical protein
MLTAEARIETERASRHLVQFCRHASQMRRHLGHGRRTHDAGEASPEVRGVEWSDTDGTVTFGRGRCVLQATPEALTVRVEAGDDEDLRRLQALVAKRLETIGTREHLAVTWHTGRMLNLVPPSGSPRTP